MQKNPKVTFISKHLLKCSSDVKFVSGFGVVSKPLQCTKFCSQWPVSRIHFSDFRYR